jgi:transposase-like protein
MKDNPIYIDHIVNTQNLIDDAKCYKTIRRLKLIDGTVQCPFCESTHVIRHGHDNTKPERQKYNCNGCLRYFGDLSWTIFEGHHQSLQVWILCLYFMGLNLSNRQIAQELDLNEDNVQQ